MIRVSTIALTTGLLISVVSPASAESIILKCEGTYHHKARSGAEFDNITDVVAKMEFTKTDGKVTGRVDGFPIIFGPITEVSDLKISWGIGPNTPTNWHSGYINRVTGEAEQGMGICEDPDCNVEYSTRVHLTCKPTKARF